MSGEPCQHHDRIERKIDRILIAIEGDEKAGHRGVVRRIEALEKWAAFIAVYCLIVFGAAVAAWWFLEPIVAQAAHVR